ncbi:GGDEF domain-containing protein [Methylophaga sp. 42_25_T18]|nr:GGDEF domain-containing protein [Methylophaga sp. 42_25_T18]
MSKIASFPPRYDHIAQKASENLRLALPLINKHKTPVNPVNYAVWYEYVSGENQQLNSAIDTRLNKNEAITDEITQYLYEKFVLMGMPERIEKTSSGMHLIVDNTMKNINKAEAKAGACATDLNNSRDQLNGLNDVEDLKSVITDILSQTQMLTDSSNDLKQELAKSTQDMIALKTELEEVKKAALTDGLTGLLNRGAFNQELEKLCGRGNIEVSLILFDLDHFKNINDTYGHLLGDKVIQFFAGILKKHGKNIHPVARYGGEEMAMIMLNTKPSAVLETAEAIRLAFANSKLKKKGSEEIIGPVSVSIGISKLVAEDSPNSIIDRADQALYLSKANGRNQVSVLDH